MLRASKPDEFRLVACESFVEVLEEELESVEKQGKRELLVPGSRSEGRRKK